MTRETAIERSRPSPALLIAAAASVVVHGLLAAIPWVFERRSRLSSTVVSFSVVRTPKPRPSPPPPPRAVQLPRPKRSATPAKAVKRPPQPKNDSVEPEQQPEPETVAPPVFGADRRSTTEGESSFGVPEGNTVATDPGNRGPVLGEHRPVAPPPRQEPRPRVRKVRTRPRLAKEYRISYPLKARSLGIEGTVRVSLLIGEDGRVKEAKVLSGPGFGLNRAARRALLRFRFHPAIATDGQPMEYRIVYRYTFQIDG